MNCEHPALPTVRRWSQNIRYTSAANVRTVPSALDILPYDSTTVLTATVNHEGKSPRGLFHLTITLFKSIFPHRCGGISSWKWRHIYTWLRLSKDHTHTHWIPRNKTNSHGTKLKVCFTLQSKHDLTIYLWYISNPDKTGLSCKKDLGREFASVQTNTTSPGCSNQSQQSNTCLFNLLREGIYWFLSVAIGQD